jgi:hypothetical protein
MGRKLNYEYVKNFISQNNCELITDYYKNSQQKLEIKCSCGEIFFTSFSKFKFGKRKCNKCVKLARPTIEDVKKYIEENSDCILLSTEYKNNHTKLKLQCHCGSVFETTLLHFKNDNKKQCNACGLINCIDKNRKDHRTFVRELYDLVGCEYSVLTIYEKANKKVKVKHNKCGHIYEVKPNNFLSGFRCPRCFGRDKITFEEFLIKLDKKFHEEVILLSDYIDYNTKIKVKHIKCNYIWDVKPRDLLHNKYPCPKCATEIIAKNKSFKYEDVKKYIESEGYELLSSNYKNAYDKLIVKCKEGHIYSTIFRNFYYSKSRCPICNESKGERRIREFFVKNNINHQKEYIFDDLKGAKNAFLRFDFAVFSDKHKLLFLVEFDGLFHYEMMCFPKETKEKAIQKFKRQQYYDKLKDEYCEKRNIKLIRIPYWDFDNIEKILEKELNF